MREGGRRRERGREAREKGKRGRIPGEREREKAAPRRFPNSKNQCGEGEGAGGGGRTRGRSFSSSSFPPSGRNGGNCPKGDAPRRRNLSPPLSLAPGKESAVTTGWREMEEGREGGDGKVFSLLSLLSRGIQRRPRPLLWRRSNERRGRNCTCESTSVREQGGWVMIALHCIHYFIIRSEKKFWATLKVHTQLASFHHS